MVVSAKITLCGHRAQTRPLFHTKNKCEVYTGMYPKLNESTIANVQRIELEGVEGFDVFREYYRAFCQLVNHFIAENNTGLIEPMLRMLSKTTNFYERCLANDEAFEDDIDNYIDGIKWVFEECAPEGFSYNGTEYVKDG